MRLKPKVKGSALPPTFVFGFAILFIDRKSQLSSETELQIDLNHLGEKIFGDYKSINTIIKTSPSFYLNNTNIELYHTELLYITYNISHKLLYKDTVKQTSNLVLNQLPKHFMIAYQDNLIPINVPYISTGRMDSIQKSYDLSNTDRITDSQRGYIGYVNKSNKSFRISVGENTEIVNISSLKLDKEYTLKLG